MQNLLNSYEIKKYDFYKFGLEPMSEINKYIFEDTNKIYIQQIKETLELIKPINFSLANPYFHNNMIFNIESFDKNVIESVLNIQKVNFTALNSIINSINFESLFNNYNGFFNDINFDDFSINSDGSIDYENEKVIFTEENSQDIVKILKSIENNTNDIKETFNKKSIAVVIFLFILCGIFSGFLNKMGETIFDNVQKSFKLFTEENNDIKNETKSKENYIKSYRIVNADELNVRLDPSSDSILLGKLYKNQCVKIIENAKYWTKVEYINKEKSISIIGWVYNRYIIEFDENTSSLVDSYNED
jgi:hypothetical protein